MVEPMEQPLLVSQAPTDMELPRTTIITALRLLEDMMLMATVVVDMLVATTPAAMGHQPTGTATASSNRRLPIARVAMVLLLLPRIRTVAMPTEPVVLAPTIVHRLRRAAPTQRAAAIEEGNLGAPVTEPYSFLYSP